MKLPEVQLTAGFYLAAALGVLLLPWNILLTFAVASAVHEIFHITVLYAFKIPIYAITLGHTGARITAGILTPAQELLCAAAGPAGSLALVLFAKQTPLLSLIGMCQGVFNLLPIYPLDGGRMVRSILMLAKMARCDYNSSDY